MVKQDRSLGMYILLSIVTCGIYSLYFVYKMAEDINTVCYGDGDETPSGGMVILLSFLTCGIYQLFWMYKSGDRMQRNAERYGMQFQENGGTVLLWYLLGMFIIVGPFIAMHILIKNMNALAAAYNNGVSGQNNYGSNSYGNTNVNYGYGNNQYNNSNASYGNNMIESAQGGYTVSNPNEYAKTQPLSQNFGNQGGISLICKKGEFKDAVFPVNVNDRIVIGRDLSCNIKFASNTPKISRKHCTIDYDGRNVWLTDNNSSFGTYLMDGTKLEPMKRVPLNPGTGFYLGSQDVVFYV